MKNLQIQILIIKALLLSITTTTLVAQEEKAHSDGMKITIDWNHEVNLNHPYRNDFINEDTSFYKWLYKNGKAKEDHTHFEGAKKRYFKYDGGNNSLVYTIQTEDETFLDTVRNVVHFSGDGEKSYKKYSLPSNPFYNKLELPKIQGRLPKGYVTSHSNSRNKFKIGIEVPRNNVHVQINVLGKKDQHIKTLHDGILNKGWYDFNWNTEKVPNGIYILQFSAEGRTMKFEIEIGNKDYGVAKHILQKLFDKIF